MHLPLDKRLFKVYICREFNIVETQCITSLQLIFTMRTFGLIGKSLTHSFSQQYFTEKFHQQNINDAEYCLFSLSNIQNVKELLKHPTLLGFNVTIPYKTEIIPYLDELDVVAQEVGAVNCVVKKNNKWVGYNTDVVGFERLLQKAEGSKQMEIISLQFIEGVPEGRGSLYTVLNLGSGGASKAVCYVLKQKNIPFQIVSRKKTNHTITYNEATELITNHYPQTTNHHTLIINTTPLGMFPNMNELPEIPYHALNQNHILIDLIYNPAETLFLKEGRKRGVLTMNGLEMFKAQAEAAYSKFKVQILEP